MKIDAEFKSLIPELSEDEYKQLEENIIKEGCRDSLIFWGDILIDGHNRYQICQNHDIPFKTHQIEFSSRDEVKIWIIKNQFGRRNLTPYDRGKLVLKMESIIKATAKEKMIIGGKIKGSAILPNPQPIDSRKEIAKIANVSEGTISKIKIIEKEASPQQKKDLSEGKKKINAVWKEIRKATKGQPRECAHLRLKIIKICKDCGERFEVK